MGSGGRTLEGTDGMRFFIMKGAKNREAAEQLIRYLLSPAIQREIFEVVRQLEAEIERQAVDMTKCVAQIVRRARRAR